jgi:hypothetical protein
MIFVAPKALADPQRTGHLSLGVELVQECSQSGAIEFPIKRARLAIV